MSRARFLESARRCRHGIAFMLLAVGLLSPAAALDDDATLSVPVVTDLPPLEWPACLVRPDVHPQILAIEAAVTRGDLDEAQRLVTAHAKGLRDAPAEARLDAQLAAAIVLDRAGDPQARRRFASVAEYAAAVGGLYSPHLLPARAGEGFAALRRGEALSAEESLTSALHLHRMRHGLHDPGQMVYLQALSALADGAAAEEQVTLLMRRQLALLQRQMLADDAAPGLLESLPELMTTLRNSTAFAALARPITELRFALQQKLDADDPALVPLLIADSHANALVAIAGESRWDARALREAYKLITSLDVDMSADARAHALVDAGNVWWLVGNTQAALAMFDVAEQLDVHTATARVRRPEALAWPTGTPRAMVDESAGGWLRLGIRINLRGDVMRITEAQVSPERHPVGVARARAWQSAARRATWRPAVVDGRAATREDTVIFDRFVPTQ
ncbi:hypothetical protein [Polycyclovorans algicola]|uniref:hypothetical protein n=1 Tax=Polycyclovorans algicola TaxID=616992 RepID=UPI0012692DCC|nr:hypothetical protein [Polycyclovorans algicola]